MLHASVLRSSNLSITEVNTMSANFLKVSCRDCSNESIIFSRATTAIACAVCGATLTNPAGGKAQLVGCNVVESLE